MRIIFLALGWIWAGLAVACLAAAALLALDPGRGRRWEALLGAGRRRPAVLAAFGLPAPLLLAVFKLAQLHSRELMSDSAVQANLVWNFAHGYGLLSSLLAGQSFLAVHVDFTTVLLSPFVLLWENTGVLAIAHGLAVGAVPLAVYLLCLETTKSSTLAAATGLLALANPMLHDMAGAFLDGETYAVAFFLWGVYCLRTGKTAAACVLCVLLLTTSEQAPILLAGFAVSEWLGAGSPRGRRTAAGLALVAAAVFGAELLVMRHVQGPSPVRDYSPYFEHLGGSLGGAFRTVLLRPWIAVRVMIHPWTKLLPVARAFWWTGFLPFFSGRALVALAAIWIPHQLLPENTLYQTLAGNHAGYVLAPLLWCSVLGIDKLRRLAGAKRAHLLPACLLVLAGYDFLISASFGLPPGVLPSAWVESGPKALAAIPRGASVWTDQFFGPQLGMRRFVKSLPETTTDGFFNTGLFVPDRVLYSQYWVRRADPKLVEALFDLFRAKGFQIVFQEKDLVVLANPATLGKEGGEPPSLTLFP